MSSAIFAFAVDPEMSQRAFQLGAAPTDVSAAPRKGNFALLLDGIGSLGSHAAINPHFAGHDGALRLLSRREKAALDKRLVEPNTLAP